MSVAEEIDRFAEESGEEFLLLEPRDMYDPCLVGVVTRFNQTFALYSRAKVIAAIMADTGCDREEAEEHFGFNIIGGWVGDGTPAFLLDDEDALEDGPRELA